MPMADWVGSCLIHETGNDWKDAPLMPKGGGGVGNTRIDRCITLLFLGPHQSK